MIGLDEWMGIDTDNPGSLSPATCMIICLRPWAFVWIRFTFSTLFRLMKKRRPVMDEWIATHGGINLMVVGVGINGHIGFNEPGTPLESNSPCR